MIKFRILKIYLIMRNALTVKHWRGHGIHSPFMYRFVREVLMQLRPLPNVNELPVNLRKHNLLKRDVLMLKNLYHYLGYENCVIVGEGVPAERTLCIAPRDVAAEDIEKTIDEIAKMYDSCCVAVMGTNKCHRKYVLCRDTVAERGCVSVNMYRNYIFFFDKRLQTQYFRIRTNII